MKPLILPIMLTVTICCTAAHFHRPVRRPPPVRVSWKTIAASGAAAGTVIAAYKVSNGVEQGLLNVAEKKPESFLNILNPLRSLSAIIVSALLLGGLFIKYKEKKQ